MTYTGENIPHDSAIAHATGESIFLDDLPRAAGEVLVATAGSPFAHARILSVDLEAARKVPGVVALLTHADVPGHNRFGPVVADEDLLAADEAVYVGHPIVLIAAENAEAIHAARRAIKFQLKELPPILSIEAAIAANWFFGVQRKIERGDVDAVFADRQSNTIEGALHIGGQEHFYLESQVAIADPGENGTMAIRSSTQHPTEVQNLVAEVLGVSFNHVVVTCKRMGGGFGGKETQAAQPAMLAALAAAATKRPARVAYDKDHDMRVTGKRHPFLAKYRAAFDVDGTMLAVDMQLFSDGGCSTDLSFAVLERAMLHADNAYFIPNFRVTGRVCKTNLPSNTAFRGFGGPQGMTAIENIVEEIASAVGRDSLDVRVRNCYTSAGGRDVTPYGQTIANNTLPELFARLRVESNYDLRRREVDRFNRKSTTHVRGLALTPVKFGISFTRRTLNQANALVNVYTDGSVLVSTGATEMGQGVNTRIRQLVADELGVEYTSVLIGPTATDKNNNTSPTAASSGTDLNGAAAIDACSRIKSRLAEFLAWKAFRDVDAGLAAEPSQVRFECGEVFDIRRPDRRITFKQACCMAYEHRVSLGERGFYATPGVDFNRETGRGNPFLYFTNGAACSEVLIDRFTGELTLPRVDLLMDVGESINPGIDRGQITGAFIQGVGWVTTEELRYNEKGHLLSYSPTTYKIPNISDTPAVFNVNLLENPNNVVSLKRSKAVGEPPLMLAISVWAAVKDALRRTAEICGVDEHIELALPATAERIALALDQIRRSGSPIDGAANVRIRPDAEEIRVVQ